MGLGYEFLRHVERTRLLVHVLDGSGGMEGRDPLEDFELVDAELLAYSDELAAKPRFAAINKIDLGEARDNLPSLHEALKAAGQRVFDISAVTGEGVPALLTAILERLRDIPRRRSWSRRPATIARTPSNRTTSRIGRSSAFPAPLSGHAARVSNARYA